MNSHEYAEALKKTAEHLLARPDVEFGGEPHVFVSFYEKKPFVEAAKAMGTGKKEFTSYDDLHFSPTGTCLIFSIARNRVCRKIQDVKWECEPILSSEEVEALESGQAAEIPF